MTRTSALVAAALIAGTVGARDAVAQLRLERFSPAQAARGETTTIRLAAAGLDGIGSVEVTPAEGITVVGIDSDAAATAASGDRLRWWQLRLAVAADATPGERRLVLVTSSGRTEPRSLLIPDHVPVISDATATYMDPNIRVDFVAKDTAGDIKDRVDVWYSLECGGSFESGISTAKTASAGRNVYSVTMTIAQRGVGKCPLKLRLTDASRVASNTLEATVDFTK